MNCSFSILLDKTLVPHNKKMAAPLQQLAGGSEFTALVDALSRLPLRVPDKRQVSPHTVDSGIDNGQSEGCNGQPQYDGHPHSLAASSIAHSLYEASGDAAAQLAARIGPRHRRENYNGHLYGENNAAVGRNGQPQTDRNYGDNHTAARTDDEEEEEEEEESLPRGWTQHHRPSHHHESARGPNQPREFAAQSRPMRLQHLLGESPSPSIAPARLQLLYQAQSRRVRELEQQLAQQAEAAAEAERVSAALQRSRIELQQARSELSDAQQALALSDADATAATAMAARLQAKVAALEQQPQGDVQQLRSEYEALVQDLQQRLAAAEARVVAAAAAAAAAGRDADTSARGVQLNTTEIEVRVGAWRV